MALAGPSQIQSTAGFCWKYLMRFTLDWTCYTVHSCCVSAAHITDSPLSVFVQQT